ncbi:MAG: hypothetical protein EB084_23390, partial [Proteobacteria bacterium]|nr:hypothetical protein [Pseudomonadota bacterium]
MVVVNAAGTVIGTDTTSASGSFDVNPTATHAAGTIDTSALGAASRLPSVAGFLPAQGLRPDEYRVFALTPDGTLLMADHRTTDTFVHVNVPTTLVSHLRGTKTGLSLADAMATVHDYLDIPQKVDFENTGETDTPFDAALFLSRAHASGGSVEQYLAGLEQR